MKQYNAYVRKEGSDPNRTSDKMEPEEEAREIIDDLLTKAGWTIQDNDKLNLGESEGPRKGIAVREFPLLQKATDYLLILDRVPVGVIEAKRLGYLLSGVADQSMDYIKLITKEFPDAENDPVFHYESTGGETFFRDLRDPKPRSRKIFAFHKPETLRMWFEQEDTLRARLRDLPKLDTEGLRKCQVDALIGLEKSFAESKPKSLIQMASGSGKTFAAVTFCYRLAKFAKAKRILFLADRNNLTKQTRDEFDRYKTPDDGRKFTEIYNAKRLETNAIDPSLKVCITTIQRVYSMLKGEKEMEEQLEEKSQMENDEDEKEVPITYNSKLPIEEFDFVVIDECHRSIYNKWRQVLEYFDSFKIGLTATPTKSTYGYFDQNLVSEYTHQDAVFDKVNVQEQIYRIKTKVGEEGGTIHSYFQYEYRDKTSRISEYKKPDTKIGEYPPEQLDEDIVNPNQIRTIIKEFKMKLPEIFPGRETVPKTLIFAKDDSHAEDITRIINEVFSESNEFCKKITYTATNPDSLINHFRNSVNPRIAVTVDMIATGTDVKPLEIVMFMRKVKTRTYYDQMVGRGSRVLSPTEFQRVTPQATAKKQHKTHFVLIDTVGVTEAIKTEAKPIDTHERHISFEKLVNDIAKDKRDSKNLDSVAARLAKLNTRISNEQREKIEEIAGIPIDKISHDLYHSTDPDTIEKKAKQEYKTESPTKEQLKKIEKKLVTEACRPFDNPKFRETIIEIHKENQQIIDIYSPDAVISSGFDEGFSKELVESFEDYCKKNPDEMTAIQIIQNIPYKKRKLTFQQLQELDEQLHKLPHSPTPENLFIAYSRLKKGKVKTSSPEKVLADLVSLVRFALQKTDNLEDFSQSANEKFEKWIKEKEQAGTKFTPEQLVWLGKIRDHIATSLSITKDDFGLVPFNNMGGLMKMYQLFGKDYEKTMEELNMALIAT